jgi:hypothetical protein
MSTKLKLSPEVSYILGIYTSMRKVMEPLGVKTTNTNVIERFIKISIDNLGIEPRKILIGDDGVSFYNSKIKKLFEKALERRLITFKYRNAYSGNYLSGLFDVSGGRDRKGLYIRNIDSKDALLLENLGVHTMVQGSKSYVIDESLFMTLIKGYSSVMKK